jgi:hypothetical protein
MAPGAPSSGMANMLLILLLVVLIALVAGPLFLLNVVEGALRIFLWVLLALLVVGLVGALLGGRRATARRHP